MDGRNGRGGKGDRWLRIGEERQVGVLQLRREVV